MTVEQDPGKWDTPRAVGVVSAALAELGVSFRGLALLRHGENITFSVEGTAFVARLARPYADPAAVDAEVAAAHFLEECGFPAARLAGQFPQPLRTPLGLMTVWHRVPGRQGDDSDLEELGRLLARLHRLAVPEAVFRAWAPLRKVPGRLAEIRRQAVLPTAEVAMLEELHDYLEDRVQHFVVAEPFDIGLCHGDADTGNLLMAGGHGVLVDWEDCCIAPWEWDLSEIVMAVRRFGLTASQYEAFLAGYGLDVLRSPNAELVGQCRELTATTWLLQNAASSAEVLAEGRLRIRTLADPSDRATWSAF